ncbi:MAG: bifunctional diaminohydroxyphosphoribosylaminopyrimidine deaminase/5-amino-6-(5-phosphoribosylamino)uracil reductase RibD [Bacillota bacterium]
MDDRQWMTEALRLAELGRATVSPNPMVGAVVLDATGEAVGRGWHQRAGEPHAEILALREAGGRAAGGSLYVTLEPCCHYGRTPPCTRAIIDAGLRRVVVAAMDPNPLVAGRGIAELRSAGVEVEVGLLSGAARRQNEVFFTFMRERRPFVALKAAMSLDGKVATVGGDSRWITSEPARERVYRLRSQYDAILVGIGTVLADDPLLTARVPGGQNPLRVVLDSRLRLPTASRLAATAGEVATLVMSGRGADPARERALTRLGIEVHRAAGSRPEPGELLPLLAQREITSLLVEGGPEVAAAFVAAGCVDKFLFFVAPMLIGGRSAPGPVGGQGPELLRQARPLVIETVEAVGADWLITAYPSTRGEVD